jgi:hypothetical protein
MPLADCEREIKAMAHQIAGASNDKTVLAWARDAAEAELDVARVRCVKAALISRVIALGRLEPAKLFRSPKDEASWIMQHYYGATLWKSRPKFAVDSLPEMPKKEPQRTAEAVRRALPSLLKLNRYESRAVARRDRAIAAISQRMIFKEYTR